MAENLGIDEVMWAAGREHLKKVGAIPADEPGKAEGAEAPAGSDEAQPEAQASRPNGCRFEGLAQPRRRVESAGNFLIFFARNPLKSLVSQK